MGWFWCCWGGGGGGGRRGVWGFGGGESCGGEEGRVKEPRAIVAADLRGNGETDLVITQEGGAPVLLKSEGGAANNWMVLDLKALSDNKSAIGTKVEVYAGPLVQKWEVAGASGYLGQNAPLLHVG